MNLEQHANKDSMKVWLSSSEVDQLLDAAKNTTHEIALGLMVRSGLRSHEVLDVTPEHVRDTDAGTMLRVWHGKGDKYRETPLPDDLAGMIRMIGEMQGQSSPVVDITTTRGLRKWVRRAADNVDSDDPAWQHVTPHDLRRTWATQLRGEDADPLVVCDWGGWNDLETFLEHYRGTSTPEAQRREREKVDWL
jgi:integrase